MSLKNINELVERNKKSDSNIVDSIFNEEVFL